MFIYVLLIPIYKRFALIVVEEQDLWCWANIPFSLVV